MNRIIKFRAWDKITNQMFQVKSVKFNCISRDVEEVTSDEDFGALKNGVNNGDCIRDKEYVELMQFTGTFDKNGKDIFEGDIVEIIEKDDDSSSGSTFEYLCEVCFGGGDYTTSFTLKHPSFYKGYGLFSDRYQIEILGNIYQVPDSLRTQQMKK